MEPERDWGYDLVEPERRPEGAPEFSAGADAKTPDEPFVSPQRTLHEREGHLRSIYRACEDVAAGCGHTIVFRGAPGVGKTALLEAAGVEGRRRGFRTFGARGGAPERDVAFGIVRQLVAPALTALPLEERRELSTGPAREAAALVTGAGQAAPTSSDSLLYGVFWLLALLARDQPLMLTVDDLHWVDAPSLRFLEFLSRRVAELPAVVIATVRSGEAPVDPLSVESMGSVSGTSVIDVPSLSLAGVQALAEEAFGCPADASFAEACLRATNGNPLFLRSLLRQLVVRSISPFAESADKVTDFGAAALSGWVRERLETMEPSATAIAKAAAVLGPQASLKHVASMAELPMSTVAALADRLVMLDILNPGEPLDFRHPILRMALLEGLGELQRGMLHLQAAEVLSDAGAVAEDVAAHLLQAPAAGDSRAVEKLRAAARGAAARGAPDVAASYLERALAEPPTPHDLPETLRELGQLQLISGNAAAVETLMRAQSAAPDEAQRAKATLPLTHALVGAGRLDDAVRVVSTALRDFDGDRELMYMLEADAAAWLVRDIPGAEWIIHRLEKHALEAAGTTIGERALLANVAYKRVLHGEGPATAVADTARRAYADGQLLHDVGPHAPSFAAAVTALAHADELDLAGRAVEAAFAAARAAGSALAFGFVSILESGIAERTGDVATMEAAGRAAYELAMTNEWHQLLPMALYFLPAALIERDRLDEAEALLGEHGYGPNRAPDSTPPTYTRALVHARSGRYKMALDDILAARDQGAWWMIGNLMPWRAEAARALHALGRFQEARLMADEELALANEWGTPRCRALALRAVAVVSDRDLAVDTLREAVSATEGTSAVLERAKALAELGSVLRRANHRRDARAPLREAVELAGRCGASATTRFAAAELEATGVRAPRRPVGGAEALTPTQRRLAAMAAAGLTNKQIAQELFVSLKTVESHLAAVFRKLGIESRSQLRHALEAKQGAHQAP